MYVLECNYITIGCIQEMHDYDADTWHVIAKGNIHEISFVMHMFFTWDSALSST